MRSDRDEIKQALKDRIEGWCQRLLPDGRREGRLWVSHNPVTGDAADHPRDPTFKVALDRDTGAWIDYRSGNKGDVVRLAEYVLGTDFRGAMIYAREFLGISRMSSEERRQFAVSAAEAREKAEAAARRKAAERRRSVERLWNLGGSLLEKTPPAVVGRRYLAEGRGIPISDVRRLDPATFRAVPSLEWWRGRQWRTVNGTRRLDQRGPSFPAIVSGFRSATGQVTGVHCTFLDPVNPAKAPVDDPKLMFGDTLGSVIAVSLGPENEPHETARVPHPLIVCEGVEDGITLAIGVPEARVWSAGALIHMGRVPAFLPCVSAVFVAADNDWKSATAQAQLDQVLEHLSSHGKPVEVMRSAIGKDFNDGMTE